MNQERDNKLPGAESDPTVSAAYRATATESAPSALDELVLKNAESAARNSGLRRFTALWFRPLAFVATLGLSLAILLELTSSPDLQSVESVEPETGRLEAELPAVDPTPSETGLPDLVRRNDDSPAGMDQSDDPSIPARLIRPYSETGRQQRLEPAPSSANAPVADMDTSAEFAEMIEASSKQMREHDSVTETADQDLQQTGAHSEAQVGTVAAFQSSATLLEEAARPCADEQIAVPMTWWQCISDLEEAGRHDEAKAELDLFNKAHPDFEAPQILPSQ